MSLDVYLTRPGASYKSEGSGIFIRNGGQTKEVTREEWDRLFPDREPVMFKSDEATSQVFSSNVTHNLTAMADEAGLYKPCWRPEECGITHAHQLVPILEEGLAKLKAEPDRFAKHNPKNGWGSYSGFVEWVEEYLDACRQYPDAEVSVWK